MEMFVCFAVDSIYFVSWFVGRRDAGESKKAPKGSSSIVGRDLDSEHFDRPSLLTDAESPQIYNSVHAK